MSGMNNLVVDDRLIDNMGMGSVAREPAVRPGVCSIPLVVHLLVLGWILLLGWGLFFEVGVEPDGGVAASKGGGWAAAAAFGFTSLALYVLTFIVNKVPKAVMLGGLILLMINLGVRTYQQSIALRSPGMVMLTRLEQDDLGAKTRILAKRLSQPQPLLFIEPAADQSGSSEAIIRSQAGTVVTPLWVDWSLSPQSEPDARHMLQSHPALSAVLFGTSNRLNLILPESSLKVPYEGTYLSLIDSAPTVIIGGRHDSEVAAFTAELIAALALARGAHSPAGALPSAQFTQSSHAIAHLELAYLKSAYNLPGTWFSPDHQALVALKVGNRLMIQALSTTPPNPQIFRSAQVWLRSAAKRVKRGDNLELRQAVYYSQSLASLLELKLMPDAPMQIEQSQIKTDLSQATIPNLSKGSNNKQLRQRLRYFANGIRNCEQSFLTDNPGARSVEASKVRKKSRAKRRCFVPKWFYQSAVDNFKAFQSP